MTGCPCNRFVSARTEQALLSKVFALQRKGWVCLQLDEKTHSAYLERSRPGYSYNSFSKLKEAVPHA